MVEMILESLRDVAGWFANRIKAKPNLCFKLTHTPTCELIEKEQRTGTSASEYSIEVFNLGQNPVIIEQFGIYYKKEVLVDCFLDDQNRTILPYEHITHILMEEEADAIKWHCKKHNIQKCKVIAIDIKGKKIKSNLDVSSLTFMVSLAEPQIVL